jgi:vancomycin resistance protein YoaR
LKERTIKSIRITFVVCLLTTFILLASYYISINTILSDIVLPNIKINGIGVSFLSKEKLKSKVEAEIMVTIPEKLEVRIGDYFYYVPIAELEPTIDVDNVVEFGKGEDLVKSLAETVTLLRGKNFEPFIDTNPNQIIHNLPFKLSTEDYVRKEGGRVINCEKNQYNFEIDYTTLKTDISEALINNEPLTIKFDRLFNHNDEIKLIKYCQIYSREEKYIKDFLSTISKQKDLAVTEIFGISLKDDESYWSIENKDLLTQVLEEYGVRSEIKPSDGKYEEYGDKILLLEMYTVGKKVDVEKSINQIEIWLKSPTQSLEFAYIRTDPEVLNKGKEVLDFTKLLGTGATRVHLVWDNGANNIYYAEEGFNELHNTVIRPNEEFSFYNHIEPSPDGTVAKSGRPIGAGICTAVTTLFRSALESGFPITARANHGYNWSKYIWPYPHGIVDATFYSFSRLDLKFINDLSYPVLLRYEKTFDDQGYQYNWLRVYTSSKAPNRSVTLSDWNIWNYVDFTHFDASFKRTVKDDGNVVREDIFPSWYDGSGRL